MDSTVSPLIGAAIALVSVFITAKLTYKNNSKLEEQKIIRQKKEEAYISCEKYRKYLSSSDLKIIKFVHSARHVSDDKYDPSVIHPLNNLRMIINLYLPDLKEQMENIDSYASVYQEYFSMYIKAHEFANYTGEEKVKFVNEARDLSKKIHTELKSLQGKLIA